MSDHISGPRALADPVAHITDVYASPSPGRPGHLVLVMNTLPFAKPWDALSEGLIYRFRLRPLSPSARGDAAPFTAGGGGGGGGGGGSSAAAARQRPRGWPGGAGGPPRPRPAPPSP